MSKPLRQETVLIYERATQINYQRHTVKPAIEYVPHIDCHNIYLNHLIRASFTILSNIKHSGKT